MKLSYSPVRYGTSWINIFEKEDEQIAEERCYREQLDHPFFRLDVVLDYNLDDQEHTTPPGENAFLDFDEFIAQHEGHQLLAGIPPELLGEDDEYSAEVSQFQQRLDFYMQLPNGAIKKDCYSNICNRVSELLRILIDQGLPDGGCADFAPSVLNGLLAATHRLNNTMSAEELQACWTPLCKKIRRLVESPIAPNADGDAINNYVYFTSSLFGFIHIADKNVPGVSKALINKFLDIKHKIGYVRWRNLDSQTRYHFTLVGLHCIAASFPEGAPFRSRIGVSSSSLRYLREALSDTCTAVSKSGESMYLPMMRYFIGKLDDGLLRIRGLYGTSIHNFSLADQMEIQSLIERFRQFRSPVTEERLVSFLAQFGTPPRMKLALRLLRSVKFYTLSNLQGMVESAFLKLADNEIITSVVPLGDIAGSTSLMNYFAGHGALSRLSFESDVTSALKNSADGSPISFLDDGTFSGTQVCNFFGDLLGTRVRKSQHTKYANQIANSEQFLQRPVRLCFAIATEKAIHKITEFLTASGFTDIEISACSMESESNKPFHASMSYLWHTTADQSEAKQMFSEIGESILQERAQKKNWPEGRTKESALGFGSDERLVIYEYNVPKSTITALWESGNYKDGYWKPLFPIDE